MAVTMKLRDEPSRFDSGDNVGNQLILAPGDFVAQPQLAFFEPSELQLIGHRRDAERNDRGIEVAMLDAKQF